MDKSKATRMVIQSISKEQLQKNGYQNGSYAPVFGTHSSLMMLPLDGFLPYFWYRVN